MLAQGLLFPVWAVWAAGFPLPLAIAVLAADLEIAVGSFSNPAAPLPSSPLGCRLSHGLCHKHHRPRPTAPQPVPRSLLQEHLPECSRTDHKGLSRQLACPLSGDGGRQHSMSLRALGRRLPVGAGRARHVRTSAHPAMPPGRAGLWPGCPPGAGQMEQAARATSHVSTDRRVMSD